MPTNPMHKPTCDRREFAAKIVLGTAAGTLAAVTIGCGGASAPASKSAKEKSAGQTGTPPIAETEADWVMRQIAHRYPENLSPERVQEIREQVAGNMARSKALSDFPLTNADEPGFAFAAYRNDTKEVDTKLEKEGAK